MKPKRRKLAPSPEYTSPQQIVIPGFESPFVRHLDPKNRWIVLANLIPWDEISAMYIKQVGKSNTGRPPLNPRVVIGSIMIRHLSNFSDRETIQHITENVYMQYFLGYSSFTCEAPFDASLFVDFRNRLGMELINAINEKIVSLESKINQRKNTTEKKNNEDNDKPEEVKNETPTNKGRLITDATVCPQDISFPTDLELLNNARSKSEELIDKLHELGKKGKKPRTYRRKARKFYLNTAKKKKVSSAEIHKAKGIQLRFLRRNLSTINKQLDAFSQFPLSWKDQKYLMVINCVFQQQNQMWKSGQRSIEDRIVSIHQPWVRPMVRGKKQAKVEFGSKINVSLVDGISFLDQLSWDAFNEGSHLMEYVEMYRKRFGFYPEEVLADGIYCTRANRNALKVLGIRLIAKPLGRPSAVSIHISPGERNPIEGKFGQAKTTYGLNRIRARLQGTSESWIASIILVLNLVKLAGRALLYSFVKKLLNLPVRVIGIFNMKLVRFIEFIVSILINSNQPCHAKMAD